MPQFQRVYPRVWADLRGAPTETKLAWLYVLTGRHRATEGYYHLPVAYAAEDMELSARKARAAIEQLEHDLGFISYDYGTQIVLIRKALSYPGQAPATPKQITGALRAIEHLTPSPLWEEFVKAAEEHAPAFAAALRNGGITSETHSEGDSV